MELIQLSDANFTKASLQNMKCRMIPCLGKNVSRTNE